MPAATKLQRAQAKTPLACASGWYQKKKPDPLDRVSRTFGGPGSLNLFQLCLDVGHLQGAVADSAGAVDHEQRRQDVDAVLGGERARGDAAGVVGGRLV